MSSEFNPYAPPRSAIEPSVVSGDGNGIWRSGKKLIVARDAHFPSRCVKCNDEGALLRKPLKLSWHHPGWYLLLFFNLLIYALVGLVVRKSAKVQVALCAAHARRRKIGHGLMWGSLAALVASFFMIASDYGTVGILSFVAGGLGILVGMFVSRVVVASRIASDEVHLRGCGAEFLAGFPERD
ncbi:MAG: hypothetical protein QM776_01650 [Rhodocyclaceae bacterium]